MFGQGNKENVCYFFPFRQGNGRPSVKIIRKFCLECMGGSYKLVESCRDTKCSLNPYRFGKDPKRARK